MLLTLVTLLSFSAIAKVWPESKWSEANPEEVGMDESKLVQARDYSLKGNGSGCIIRGGRKAIEWGDQEKLYDLKSTTKSIGLTALGLAIKDGNFSLRDKAVSYHPDFGVPPESNTDTGWLDDITIYHLATQTAGFDAAKEHFGKTWRCMHRQATGLGGVVHC